jgi:hypothetical protein
MSNRDGSLFHVLKSHKQVDDFRFALVKLLEHSEIFTDTPEALVSMARQLLVDDRPLTVKQVLYCIRLLEKVGLRQGF